MRTLSLGEAGVQVSALCLGCMFFGTRVDEATSMRVLDRYAAAGGSCLGTAPGASREQDGEGRGLKRRIISNMALGPTLLW